VSTATDQHQHAQQKTLMPRFITTERGDLVNLDHVSRIERVSVVIEVSQGGYKRVDTASYLNTEGKEIRCRAGRRSRAIRPRSRTALYGLKDQISPLPAVGGRTLFGR
jgi:hypothetical protein